MKTWKLFFREQPNRFCQYTGRLLANEFLAVLKDEEHHVMCVIDNSTDDFVAKARLIELAPQMFNLLQELEGQVNEDLTAQIQTLLNKLNGPIHD